MSQDPTESAGAAASDAGAPWQPRSWEPPSWQPPDYSDPDGGLGDRPPPPDMPEFTDPSPQPPPLAPDQPLTDEQAAPMPRQADPAPAPTPSVPTQRPAPRTESDQDRDRGQHAAELAELNQLRGPKQKPAMDRRPLGVPNGGGPNCLVFILAIVGTFVWIYAIAPRITAAHDEGFWDQEPVVALLLPALVWILVLRWTWRRR